MKKLLFIYNPRAGKGQIKGKLADILDVFAANHFEITVHPTRYQGDAKEFVEDLKEAYDLIVCSGGDGTLDEVVSGLVRSGNKTPLGYIPAGSTNDFGGSLGLPKNMVEAAEIAVTGKDFLCDVGQFDSDIFVYIAAFGLFTEVSYETDQDMKNVLGHMAYLLEGMRRLSVIKSYHMKVTYTTELQSGKSVVSEAEALLNAQKTEADVQETIEDDFMFGMITNSVSVGGFKNITGNHVYLDDGLFEVTLIKRPKTAVELNQLIAALLNRNIDSDYMYYFRTPSLQIESAEAVAWTLDGENGGVHEKVQIKNLHRGIDIRAKL